MTRSRPATPQPRAWQRMLSGRRLNLLDPSPMDVEIEDIAHGLARVARWNGQTVGANVFSVAQHSIVVEQLVTALGPRTSPHEQLFALLHDAPEYVIGDMISPFKAVLGNDYKAVEARLAEAVHLRFGLPALTPPALKKRIKKADLVCAWLEAVQLAGFSHGEADQFFIRPPETLDLELVPLAPEDAKAAFIARHVELLADIDAVTETAGR